MTNEAILAILEYFGNEARNAMHTILGIMDLPGEDSAHPSHQVSAALGRASADQLLRSIDDLRELVAAAPAMPSAVGDVNLVLFLHETIEVLNAAAGRRRRKIAFDSCPELFSIRQDGKEVEQVLTRVLDAASKLARSTQLHVNVARPANNGVRMVIDARDPGLSSRLVNWLNATLDQVRLQDPDDLPFGVAVMVAGKRLRALGGSAAAIRDSAGHCSLAIDLPSRPETSAAAPDKPSPDGLSILVAEDCDESFFLTELMLQNEDIYRARDGEEALRHVQKQRFDLVLMDVHMPGMDGYKCIRGIRDWETQTGNARTPLVVLSSDDLETQQRSAAESGCSGFLRKPLRRSELQILVDRVKQARRFAA